MYLNGYVKKFGEYTFEEKPFCLSDALVFACLVYSNFEVVAPSIHSPKEKPTLLKDISDFDLTIVTAGKTFASDNYVMLDHMRFSKRYRDVGVKFVDKVFDKHLSNQFYACTFFIPGVGAYVAYRGTDSTIVGWREDLTLGVQKVIPSQLDAVDYLEIVSSMIEGPIYVGGHSKGGNLTLYTAIHVSKPVQDRIVNAYSFDGNGIIDNEFYDSPEYKRIEDRVVFLVPKDCVIGEIFYNPKKVLITKSRSHGLRQHYPHFWKFDYETGDFNYSPSRTKKALYRHRMLKEWIKVCPIEDRKLMIEYVTRLFGGIDRTTSHFFGASSRHKFGSFREANKHYTREEKKRLWQALKLLYHCYKDSKRYYKAKQKALKDSVFK